MLYNDNEHDDYDDNNTCNINAGAAGSGVERRWVFQRRFVYHLS